VLRFFGEDGADRLVLVNLGGDLELTVAPEPLLAPPAGRRWDLLWSSENPAYGGGGGPVLETTWVLPGHAAIVLHPTLTSGRRAAEVRGGGLARRQT
jgi:maltooligosyltrehalose trehalohydrolase